MTMDYNKWGVVTGIVALISLLISPPLFTVFDLLNAGGVATASTLIRNLFLPLSLILGITTVVLGTLSLKKGNKKKWALILGIVYLLMLIAYFYASNIMRVSFK